MKPPTNESVVCKDIEQLRHCDWLMRLTRNDINVYRRFAKITPIEFTTKPISRGNIDCKWLEKMPPFDFKTRPMRTGNIDYTSSDRITRVEFRTKRMSKGDSDYSGSDIITRVEFRTKPRTDDADWKFTDKMMLFDATTGSKNWTISKILVSDIFPTDGRLLTNLDTSNSGFRMRWPNFTVVLTV